MFMAARVIGPAIAGLVIAGLGVSWCFFANGVSYSAAVLAFMAMREKEFFAVEPVPKRKGQLREGLRYVVDTGAATGPRAHGGDRHAGVQLPGRAAAARQGDVQRRRRDARRAVRVHEHRLGHRRTGQRARSAGESPVRPRRRSPSAPCSSWRRSRPPSASSSSSRSGRCGGNRLHRHGQRRPPDRGAPEMRGRVAALFTVAFLGSTPIGGPIIGWVSQQLARRGSGSAGWPRWR